MADDLNTKGTVELQFTSAGAAQLISDLGRVDELTGGAYRSLTRLEQQLVKANAAAKTAAGGTAAFASQQRAAATASRAQESALIRQRYALYDVASTYGIISAALLAAAGYAVVLGANFESAFTNVERTSNSGATALAGLREELVDLSTQAPLTFAELSKIATLGNQLGIPENAIKSFTETVSRFATVTGLSVEAAATAFGSLGELLNLAPADYEKLGSAIAYVGRNSVATEAEIVALTTRLAASATNAGFTAQEVVALSGALASLRVAPERAQGVLETYFNRLNNALAEGGAGLQTFANVAGLTTDQVRALVKTDPNAFFRRFAAGLGSLDSVTQTQALEALGLAGIRAGEVFGRISGNLGVFDKALADANSSYTAGTELASQYAKVVDDLNSRWMMFVNSINALVEALSGGAVSGLSGLLAVLTDVVNQAREFASAPLVQVLAQISLAITAVVGAFLAYRTAVALTIAATYALTTAQGALAGASGFSAIAGALGVLVPQLATYTAALRTAAGAGAAFAVSSAGVTTSLAATGAAGVAARVGVAGLAAASFVAVPAVVALGAVIAALPFAIMISDASSAAQGLNKITTEAEAAAASGYTLRNALDASLGKISDYENDLAGINGGTEQLNATVNDFFNQFFNATPVLKDAQNQLGLVDGQLAALVNSGHGEQAQAMIASVGISALDAAAKLPLYAAALAAVGRMTSFAGGYTKAKGGLDKAASSASAFADSLNDVSSAAGGGGGGGGGATKAIRTLVDYASDLSQVFSRAFEIRFGGQEGLDTISSGWISVANATEEANQRIADYQATMQSLTADKAIKEYWLSVAENYGDALRAGALRAELAEIDNDLAKTSKDLTKEQDKNSKSLVGNSEGAIENRAVITGLLKDYEGYITQLASSGLSQDELRAKTAQLKQDFLAQATQLGYNSSELGIYAAAFDDVTTAINGVPRDITVDANADPALQALAELQARINQVVGGGGGGGYSVPISATVDSSGLEGAGIAAGAKFKSGFKIGANGAFLYTDGTGSFTGNGGSLKFVKDGGYITGPGTGTSDSIPAMLSNKEFVFSARAVRNLGVNNLAFMHNMAKRGRGYASGGPVGGGGSTGGASGDVVAHLSARDRQYFVDLITTVQRGLSIPGHAIRDEVSAGNVNDSNRRNS